MSTNSRDRAVHKTANLEAETNGIGSATSGVVQLFPTYFSVSIPYTHL